MIIAQWMNRVLVLLRIFFCFNVYYNFLSGFYEPENLIKNEFNYLRLPPEIRKLSSESRFVFNITYKDTLSTNK